MVCHNLIKNCSVTRVTNAYKIIVTDLEGMRCKTVRKKPERVVTDDMEIPMKIKMHLSRFTLTGNVMFMNKLPFFMTFGRDIGLPTVEFTLNRTAK